MAVAAHFVGTLINIGLKVVPIPYLDTSFSILTTLYTSIQHVRGIKAQMIALAASIEQLLCHLNVELHGMDHLDKSIEILLEDFTSLLLEISETAEKYSQQSYLKIAFMQTDGQKVIDQHQLKISQISSGFQTRLQILMHNDMRKFEVSRQTDVQSFEMARQTDMRIFEEGRKADMQKFEDARKEDRQKFEEVLDVIRDLQTERRLSRTASQDEAAQDDSRRPEKYTKDHSNTVHNIPDERDNVNKILKGLNQSSVFVVSQYQGSNSTGRSTEQYSPDPPPNYTCYDEPGPMAEHESKMPPNWASSAHRPIFPPVHGAYASYPPATAPFAPTVRNAYDNNNQPGPYNLFGHNIMQIPTAHHYNTAGY